MPAFLQTILLESRRRSPAMVGCSILDPDPLRLSALIDDVIDLAGPCDF